MTNKIIYTCGIFTNIAPIYIQSLWQELSQSDNIDYVFYSSQYGFCGIKPIDINNSMFVNSHGTLKWMFLTNICLKNIVLYQRGLISQCIRQNYDAFILYGEMYNLSSWIAALICKARNKPLFFWGHGMYGSENYIKKTIRLLYCKLADYHLVYGQRARHLMIQSGFDANKIYVVYNSLNFRVHRKLYEEKHLDELHEIKLQLFPNRSDLPIVIFIGRLTKEKKIPYLLEAIRLCKLRGNNYNCLIVGGGNESNNLRTLSCSMGINESVCFYGPNYDEHINAKLIMLAECCVSPGNVGLTAIHSLSLGTPVITHRNMLNQGPEAEAVIHGETGLLFEEDDAHSLSVSIDDMILNSRKVSMEANCIEQVKKYWNPMNQTAIFDEAVIKSVKAY